MRKRWSQIQECIFFVVYSSHHLRFAFFPGYPANEVRSHLERYYPGLVFSEGDVVIDLGANEGWFSRAVADSGATIIAFEPNPFAGVRAIRRLRRFPNVTVITAAVGDRTGLVTLRFPVEYKRARVLHSGSASVEPSNRAVADETGLAVLGISLESLLRNIERVKFLKIDIEGSERTIWPVLEKYSDRIDYCAIETHERLMLSEADWVPNAKNFIDVHGLSDKWRLDWP